MQKNTISFRQWIDSKRATNSIFGDFVRDAKEDKYFPEISSFSELESYLISKNACLEAL